MSDKVFPEGIRVFKPHEKAPNFVIGNVVISRTELIEWLEEQSESIRLVIKDGKKGYYLEVDTYERKPEPQAKAQPKKPEPGDDLPF